MIKFRCLGKTLLEDGDDSSNRTNTYDLELYSVRVPRGLVWETSRGTSCYTVNTVVLHARSGYPECYGGYGTGYDAAGAT